ncbi:hypothetical protein ACFCVO_07965 [Agromyces sp. NPDC056379]|uniref:hypothetical protein n=1 Tax=unclassified Agromyces TaxID=2639701 RepID=UPI0035DE25F8
MNRDLQIEWLMACLAPWTVSPHPNFSEDDVAGASRLALVTEMRLDRESGRYGNADYSESALWPERLVAAARSSIEANTQVAAIELLWELAFDDSLPAGARTAAALYGSVGLADVDHADKAVGRLTRLIAELEMPANGGDTPTFGLLLGALHLQLSARNYDIGAFEDARAAADAALRWLPQAAERHYDKFSVSRGISWGSSTVQRDVAKSMKQHAISTKSLLEGISGELWVSVVRSRINWVDARLRSVSAARDEMVVRDAFEKRFDSTSGARVFAREAPYERGYSVLLIAELSGSVSRIRSERESLGKVLLVSSRQDVHATAEAVKLLRQAKATKPLESAVRWLRGQGPSNVLRIDSERILERGQRLANVTEADLIVLAASADYLLPEDLRLAVQIAANYPNAERRAGQAGWSIQDKMWKAISKLVEDSGEDEFVAVLAIEALESGEVNQPMSTTIGQALEKLDWALVTSETAKRFKTWLQMLPDASDRDENEYVRFVLRERFPNEAVALLPSPVGRLALLADEGLGDGQDASDIDKASLELSQFLKAEAANSIDGRISFGGTSTADVAAAFAIRFSDDRVWETLTEYLSDARVHAQLKQRALDRIASFSNAVPQNIQSRLKSSWAGVIDSKRDDGMFGEPPLPVFAAAVRAGGSIGAITEQDALDSVMALAAANEQARIQAARTIPYVLDLGDPTWGHTLLLQMARDSNPDVRAAAGQSMVLSLRANSGLNGAVHERVLTLLSEDGIRVPLGVLHGIQRAVSTTDLPDTLTDLMKHVARVAESHTVPRVVRKAAAHAVELFQGKSEVVSKT